jgi:hypothetical protein
VDTDERANRRVALAALVAELDEQFGRPDPAEVERFTRQFLLPDRPDNQY